VHATEHVTDKNRMSSNRSSRSPRILYVVLILDVYGLVLGNAGQWGKQFSAVHYYTLGWYHLPNFIKISKQFPIQVLAIFKSRLKTAVFTTAFDS